MQKQDIKLNEINGAIEEVVESIREIKWVGSNPETHEIPYKEEILLVTTVEEYGGEGQGDDYWMVCKVENKDGSLIGYLKWDGWYASYDGGYLEDDPFWVEPKEKVVTVWE